MAIFFDISTESLMHIYLSVNWLDKDKSHEGNKDSFFLTSYVVDTGQKDIIWLLIFVLVPMLYATLNLDSVMAWIIILCKKE
jgi:hypothetical protein